MLLTLRIIAVKQDFKRRARCVGCQLEWCVIDGVAPPGLCVCCENVSGGLHPRLQPIVPTGLERQPYETRNLPVGFGCGYAALG